MEIKYDLSVAPYYDTTTEELNKNYIQYLAVDGQRLQNRELNVAQGLIRGNARKITDLIIEDGSIVSGCNFVNDNVNKICTLYEGEVYVNGVVVKIPETQWTHSQVPEDVSIVFADILPVIVTSSDDTSLYNPAENYESFGDPGGHRLKYVASVGIVKEEDFTEILLEHKTIVSIIKIKERNTYGPIKSKPLFNKINTQMNQRTYDSSGDFIAEGLRVSTLRHADNPLNKYEVRISKGRCYVKGEVYNIQDTTLVVDNSSINVDSTLIRDLPEEHIYTTNDINYYLNHAFVKEVINVFGNVVITGLSTVSIGLIDDISPAGYSKEKIIDIDNVYTNSPAVTYIKKNATNALTGLYDYETIGSKIIWNTTTPVNVKPAGTFFVDFIYNKSLTNLVDYYLLQDELGYYIKFKSTSSNDLKAGLTFKVNYSWYMPRMDLVYISDIGIPSVKQGLASDESNLTEPVTPAGSLPLAVVSVIPDTEPYNYYVRSFNLYRVPVGQLQDIKKRVDNLEYDVVMSNLETQVQSKHLSTDTNGAYSLRNIYTDPIVDYSKADISSEEFSATVDIFRRGVYLPMQIEQIGLDKASFTLSYKDVNGTVVRQSINPIKDNIVSLKDTDSIIATSSQMHATHDIDITPYYYKGLKPTLECEPNKLVYVEDDPRTTVVWLPNRVIYSTHYVDSIVKEEEELSGTRRNATTDDINAISSRVWDPNRGNSGGWTRTIRSYWSNQFANHIVYGTEETGEKDYIYKITGSTSSIKSTSVETVEVTKSAITLIAQPFMKAGQKVLVRGKDFTPNTEILIYLDEKVVTTEFTNTRYSDALPPITAPSVNDKPIDPTFETINYVPRPWQWSFNLDHKTRLWRLWHPLWRGRGIEYYYRYYGWDAYGMYRPGSWYYRILGFHTDMQTLPKPPGWSKYITRSPWIQDSIQAISDEQIRNEINSVNKKDPTTNTEYTTEYSEAKVVVITDNNGEFEVEISIPENTSVGTHIITAETVLPENFDPDYYKEATTSFKGESYLRHWDTTVYKRIVENIEQTVYRDVTVVKYMREITRYVDPDPISQTFKVATDQYLVGLDLYFSRVPDISDTVTQPWIGIREIINGIPSSTMLYSQNIDKSTIVDADDPATGIKASRPTFIKFDRPVYVQANKSYAFTIGANRDGYHVYYSSVGNRDLSTGEAVLYQKQQSEDGVMMVSSNNNTWTPMQEADIKYTLYRANYNTNNPVTLYIHDIDSQIPNFSSMNLTLANTIFENTGVDVYYTINSSDIYSTSTRWIPLTLEELIEFDYSDIYNNGMKVDFKVVLWSSNPAMSPIVNINNFELFLAKYLTRGTYSQLPFTISY